MIGTWEFFVKPDYVPPGQVLQDDSAVPMLGLTKGNTGNLRHFRRSD
jgi:hypothetical protein